MLEFDIGNAPPPVNEPIIADITKLATTLPVTSTSTIISAVTVSASTMSTVSATVIVNATSTTSAVTVNATSTISTASATSTIPGVTVSATSGLTTTDGQITDSINVATPIAVSSFNTKPICTPTNTTLDESDSSLYSIEVTVPDYKSTCSTPLKVSTPSNTTSGTSPGKYSRHSSPGKTNQHYEQLNTAVLGISTRLAKLEDGIYSRLSIIQTHLENLSGVSISSSCGSSSDDLWSGLDADFVASDMNNSYLFYDSQQEGSSSHTCYNTLSMRQ